MATREQIQTAALARLAAGTVAAYTTEQVNADGFVLPETYAEVRISTTQRGLQRSGSGTSGTAGWRIEVDVVGRLAVNVNRYLDRCQTSLYGHRLVVGGEVSTPIQEGTIDPAEPTGDERFSAFGDWTLVL